MPPAKSIINDILYRQSLVKKLYKNSECEKCGCLMCVLKLKMNKKTYEKEVLCEECFNIMIKK